MYFKSIEPTTRLIKINIVQNVIETSKDLKPSGIGIVVDTSKATKEIPMRGTNFPKESNLNEE